MITILKDGTITSTPGFQAAGMTAGIKESGKKDLSFVFSEEPAIAAVALTQNKFRAAPVDLCAKFIEQDQHRGIIINSGNANACTGDEGAANALEMCEIIAKEMNVDTESIFVASTGVIGKQLPMDIIRKGLTQIPTKLSREGGNEAAAAIMTTDLTAKQIAVYFEIDGEIVTISGMAKGSGMIHPNMATMIAVLTTDANITKEMLQKSFSASVNTSYNMISVDGDTSTNDSAFIFANGKANNPLIDGNSDAYIAFKRALDTVNQALAKMIARDGEGATKLLEVRVEHARSLADAQSVAKSVITSSLVKTAIFGEDANWGRIICAVGNAGAEYDPSKVQVFIENGDIKVQIVADGSGASFDTELLDKLLKEDTVTIFVDLMNGGSTATAWGCDLSYDYVKINADYRT
ncbi:bifunctional glutamate N-acetyltransferase/amino-acid acetyltransferase ArgJ [Ignatzschineria rhizosphaerae]|uniref:Arginine biosynthesis bifunctional protein ArgJ n=1 Tax=Ignatzschineria rhizosphaerae TaxID=2923279 RepID=A0ABY3X2K4_9GAMM|nr:bifunctional glutamate N-acetyltransferase/amino-acid acetyltransferase ArgJ [Ignatzschineria rhizosphaerae]UNM94966.1 bifunctional glutamate N-acetyltransferase/amino-acid acetyltransferase ArgJ [Ignatzschineria rhizosphaerae]